MRLKFITNLLSGVLLFYLIACSSSEKEIKVTNEYVDTSYVFDKIPPENIYKIEEPEKTSDTIFTVQIGAFSNLENAKKFAEFSRVKLKKEIKVEFKERKNLYVVWIQPSFKSKVDARILLNEISKYDEYRDAWILTTILIKNKKG